MFPLSRASAIDPLAMFESLRPNSPDPEPVNELAVLVNVVAPVKVCVASVRATFGASLLFGSVPEERFAALEKN
jgi:hypothetical protein